MTTLRGMRLRDHWAPLCLLTVLVCLAARGLLAAAQGQPLRAMVPALELMAAVVAVPIVLRMRAGRCDMFDPVMFAAWSAFVPGFVLGGASLVSQQVNPRAGALLSNVPAAYSLSLYLAAVGFAALAAGFAAPWAAALGRALGRRLPAWPWPSRSVIIPALLVLAAAIAFLVVGFRLGLVGSQYTSMQGRFDALIVFSGHLTLVFVFVLWMVVWSGDLPAFVRPLLVALLVGAVPLHTFLAGNRGTPLTHAIAFGAAYCLARRPIRLRHVVGYGVILVGSIGAGMLYGSVFRDVKAIEESSTVAPSATPSPTTGSRTASGVPRSGPSSPPTRNVISPQQSYAEGRVSLEEQTALAAKAVDTILGRGLWRNGRFVLRRAAARLDYVSGLSVIVDNYKRLKDAEDKAGLSNNIWTMTWTSVIPRALWPNKPVISNMRAFGEVYYHYGRSSPIVTPMGDLIRNFGWVGVVLGMGLLGGVLRIAYSALVEVEVPSLWRAAVYFNILTHVNYEGLYGALLPELMRTTFLVVLSMLFVEGWRRVAAGRATASRR